MNRLVSTGLLLLSLSFFLMSSVGPLTSLLLITLWAAVGRLGLGFVLPSLNLGAMRGLPDALISHGASTINFLRQLGGAIGIGVVGNVLEWRLRAHATTPLAAFHETFALVGAVTGLAIVAAWRMGSVPCAALAAEAERVAKAETAPARFDGEAPPRAAAGGGRS